MRTEAVDGPGAARAPAQWARLASPLTLGEQGPLVAAGIPAVQLSVSGERRRRPPTRVPGRLQAFGRAALRALTALDDAPVLRRATPVATS